MKADPEPTLRAAAVLVRTVLRLAVALRRAEG